MLMLPHKELPESTRWKKIMQARQSISTWRTKVILNTSRIKLYPFRNSRFYQEVHLNVHDNATMIYSEVIVPGRVASGEAFEYDICYIRTVGKNQLGKDKIYGCRKVRSKERKHEDRRNIREIQSRWYNLYRYQRVNVKDLQHEIQ